MRRYSVVESQSDAYVQVGDIELDEDRHEVRARGALVELTPKEFGLLSFFLRHPGLVFSRQVLIERVWRDIPIVDARTIDVHVRWLRAKLEQDPAEPKYIITIRGRGYKFAADPHPKHADEVVESVISQHYR